MTRRLLKQFGIVFFTTCAAFAQGTSNVSDGGLSFHLTLSHSIAECSDPSKVAELSTTIPNIVHYVKWKDDGTYDEKWLVLGLQASTSDSKRIFGAKSVQVIAIHENVTPDFDFAYSVNVKKKSPSWFQDLTAVVGLAKVQNVCRVGYLTLTQVPAPSDITVSAKQSVMLHANMAAAPGAPAPAANSGGLNSPPLPVAAAAESPDPAFTETFDNEGKYRFDFSFGLPVLNQKISDFQITNGVLQRTTGSRAAATGFVNIFLTPRDTKSDQFLQTPHLMLGLPLTGEALHNPVAALGLGISRFGVKFDLYAGCAFNRTEVADASGTGTSARWVRKLTVGLNIPVSQFVSAYLKKK